VYHYGHKDSKVECTEHIPVTFDEDLKIAYGSYDWRKEFFKHNTADHAHQIFNQRAIVEVGKRKQPQDFLLMFWGYGHAPVMHAHPDLIAVEPGIGCANKPCTPQAIYESHAIMNVVYGKYDRSPHWYDAVIPNYFDPEDFTYNETPQDYFVMVGRVIDSKGVGIAIDVTKRLGVRLLVAGQGSLKDIRDPVPDHVTEVGYVEPKQRAELMRNAKALFAPTHFNEPFGGVSVEALFCGTPVITSDWGGFSENNLHGITGYRCRTIEQFVWAAKNIDKISRKACYEWAMTNFSLERVARMYEEYFESLLNVHNGKGGFYAENPTRENLDWLQRYYPVAYCPAPPPGISELPPRADARETSRLCDGPRSQPRLTENTASLSEATLDLAGDFETSVSLTPNTLLTIRQLPDGTLSMSQSGQGSDNHDIGLRRRAKPQMQT
jgi:glycosyltransferase involved in cell wall biosynthesis